MFGGCDDDVAEGRIGVGFALAGVVGSAGCCGRVGDVVYEETLVGVGELLRLVVADLWEDDRGQGRGGGRGCAWGGVFGENGCAVGDAGTVYTREWLVKDAI